MGNDADTQPTTAESLMEGCPHDFGRVKFLGQTYDALNWDHYQGRPGAVWDSYEIKTDYKQPDWAQRVVTQLQSIVPQTTKLNMPMDKTIDLCRHQINNISFSLWPDRVNVILLWKGIKM